MAGVACIAAPAIGAPAGLRAQARGEDGRVLGVHQTVSVTAMQRRYEIGTTRVDETSAPASWRLVGPRGALRVSGTPLSLETTNPSLDASLRAVSPVQLRGDLALRAGDTLSVWARSGSSPIGLNTNAVRAVNAAGTNVLDLSSTALGVPALGGARLLLSVPTGDVVLGVSGGVEYEPRPRGGAGTTDAVYWRGTTVSGAFTVNALAGVRSVSAGIDVSYSRSDSLGGRNQFPGGGAVGLSASLSGPVRETSPLIVATDAFYVRPFANTRTDQPTRLIPSGDFAGVNASLLAPVRALTFVPTLSVLRESSRASLATQDGGVLSRSTLTGSAWSLAGSLGLDVPLGRIFTLSPEAGAITGRVSSTLQQTTGRPIGRRGRPVAITTTDSFGEPVRGWWAGIGLSARF